MTYDDLMTYDVIDFSEKGNDKLERAWYDTFIAWDLAIDSILLVLFVIHCSAIKINFIFNDLFFIFAIFLVPYKIYGGGMKYSTGFSSTCTLGARGGTGGAE